ncbi:MAG TPA: protein kinase [Chroococcales cyanobacterium]
MAEGNSSTLWRTWGSIPVGGTHVEFRQIALILGCSVWLGATLWKAGTTGIIALALNLTMLTFVGLMAWTTRTVSLKTVATMFFAGGVLMGAAYALEVPLALVINSTSPGFRPFVLPPIEEFLKIAPVLWMLIVGRKFSSWTYGATDLLLFGVAAGAGFAFVEDACRYATTGLQQQVVWLPTAEIINGRFIAGQAIWTGLAAGTIGLVSIWQHRLKLPWLLAAVGIGLSTADHVAANFAEAAAGLGATAFNYALLNGYSVAALFVAVVIGAVLSDRWVLAVSLPKTDQFNIPKGKDRKDTLEDFWHFVLERRKLAYAYYKAVRSTKVPVKEGALVVALLMQHLIDCHKRKPVPVMAADPLDRSQAETRIEPLPLFQTSWDDQGQELDLPERFHVLSLISEGGMGAIFKAKHMMTGAKIAIKVLHPHLARDPHNVKRFEVEARAASALSHPNLVAVYDYGTTPKKIPFLVMELIEGSSLQQVIRGNGALPIDRFLTIFSQASDGLSHAHKRGVIHRDLKPSNMILTAADDGTDFIRIVDFGIAKVATLDGVATQELTKTGDIIGSPMYMSPEQCMGEALDSRSDIYSLGCVMYEGLTGQPPFLGSNAVQTIFKHINEMPPRPRDVRPDSDIPGELEGVLFRALQKDPGKRYATMDELRNDLEYVKKVWTGERLENLWGKDT